MRAHSTIAALLAIAALLGCDAGVVDGGAVDAGDAGLRDSVCVLRDPSVPYASDGS